MFAETMIVETKFTIPDSVTNCNGMFENSHDIKTPVAIPEGVVDCTNMYKNCYELTAAPSVPASVEQTDGMFEGCSPKVEKAGKWNIKHRDQSYYDKMAMYDTVSFETEPELSDERDEPTIPDDAESAVTRDELQEKYGEISNDKRETEVDDDDYDYDPVD
jgi:hypothetical protein